MGTAAAGGFATVAQGAGAAALSGYQPFENTDPSTPERVSFILKARNLDQLQAQVLAGMPNGYLTVPQFARTYGQSPVVITLIRAYLAGFGIQSQALPNGLDIESQGTAGQYNKAFQIVQQDYRIPPAPGRDGRPGRPSMVVHGTTANPVVPRALANVILSVLGLANWPTSQSMTVGMADQQKSSDSSTPPAGMRLPSDFASAYNLSPLQASGAVGQGRTIGIVTLAAIRPNVAADFWQSIGLTGDSASADRITPVNVDGGPGAPSANAGSDETALDVEQSGALAPAANVNVYQAPNTDNGFVDAFFQAASDNVADSVSASWGESESIIKAFQSIGGEDINYAQSFDEAFLELAAQGQSTFLSSGDSGAYPASRDLGSTDRTAGNPDDSPYVTSSGGTTAAGTFTVGSGSSATTFTFPKERTWGWDYLWAPRSVVFGEPEIDYAFSHVVGSGGGYSGIESMPSYQRGVRGTTSFSAVDYLEPTGYSNDNPYYGLTFGISLPYSWDFNPTPSVTTGTGDGRATPDLAANADPETGYGVLYTFNDDSGDTTESWLQFGGTSFVAPQLNGATAVIDSAVGHRVGLWNPAIYKFATQRNSPFTPLDEAGTNNDNLYYTGTPGNIYNVGSGLGTPDLAKLAADFASSAGHRR